MGLDEPRDLATTSLIPTTSQAALIGPPAIMPVPEGADLNNTFPAPSFDKTSWCKVRPSFKGILNKLFFAVWVAFLIASGTCFAFAYPIPIEPAKFPTTIKAETVNLQRKKVSSPQSYDQ